MDDERDLCFGRHVSAARTASRARVTQRRTYMSSANHSSSACKCPAHAHARLGPDLVNNNSQPTDESIEILTGKRD